MSTYRLSRPARVVITMCALYNGAIALSAIFVSIYLWVNSHDFTTVCSHHVAVFAVTPVVFLFSGWYAQTRDRLHLYRIGLVLHVVFYGSLLLLRARSPEYAVHLGVLLGVTWGIFWAGSNTLNYDVTALGEREYFFGMMSAIAGILNLAAPALGGIIIQATGATQQGYHAVFALAVLMFVLCIALSYLIPSDHQRRPYKLMRALFPGKDQRDWRLMMAASLSLAGNWHIFPFLLGMLMYLRTGNELAVGAFGSFQALASILTSLLVGRLATAHNRRSFLKASALMHAAAGCLILLFPISLPVLLAFAFMRSIAQIVFNIPHAGLNLDIISKSAEETSQRIEYICAWEMPLGIGRVIMMFLAIGLYYWMSGSDYAFRIVLCAMCMLRIITYQIDIRTSVMRAAETPAAVAVTAGEAAAVKTAE